MDRGAWWATIHRVRKSQTQLSMHTQVNQDDLKSLNYITKTLLSNKLAFLSSGMWTYLSVGGEVTLYPTTWPKDRNESCSALYPPGPGTSCSA